MADNAGLVGLLLEQHQLRPPPAAAASRARAQITSKATRPLLLATAKNDVVDVQKGASSAAASFGRFSSSSSRAPAPTVSPTTTACPFLQRCFFCHGELADGRDIYMYRGERAFCSEECRCRHILAEEDDDDTPSVGVVAAPAAAAADCSTQLRHQALAASFTF